MKKIIRLTESELVRLVKKAIKEQEENDFDFYMEELGEYANKVQWDGYRPKGKEMKYFIGEIVEIVRKAKENSGLTEDEISKIEDFADDIISELY